MADVLEQLCPIYEQTAILSEPELDTPYNPCSPLDHQLPMSSVYAGYLPCPTKEEDFHKYIQKHFFFAPNTISLTKLARMWNETENKTKIIGTLK